jgi:hypothetical protein
MLTDIRMCEDFAFLTNVPFEVVIVNKDIIYSNPCPISISLNFESVLTEIGYRLPALFKSYIHTLEDKIYKFNVNC